MALKEIKRTSAKKVRRHLFRVSPGGAWENANFLGSTKRGTLSYEVVRTYEKGGAFKSRACMMSRKDWIRRDLARTTKGATYRAYKRHNRLDGERCAEAQGPTPTRAVKRAVTKLMKKIK